MEVDSTDREKTAFTMQRGLFQFLVNPFGLCNASSTFQRLMELVLTALNWEICLAYIDDIVVFGRSWEEHMQHLRVILTQLQEAHLKIHPRKCQFFRRSVAFLGHITSSNGVSTDPDKIAAIVNWPPPINL